jgi:hypothetical protein
MAALSGPMLMKRSSSITNMAGQNTHGEGERTANSVNTMEIVSVQPDKTKSAPGQRRANVWASRPPSSVPTKPATTSSTPNVEVATASGMPRSRTK